MNGLDWNDLANLSESQIGPREEDVKFKVVAPLLRLLGFADLEFSFETPADLGRIDIGVEGFPVGVVVECKGPNARVEDYIPQAEKYVRETMTRQHAAMAALLTNGKRFLLFAVLDAIHRGELADHLLFEFHRPELKTEDIQRKLNGLLSRNFVAGQAGNIRETIDAALRAKREDRQKREILNAEKAELSDRLLAIEDQLRRHAAISGEAKKRLSAQSRRVGAEIKWSKAYGDMETVCGWISDLLGKMAPLESAEWIPHSRLNQELCAFLSDRGTEEARSMPEEQRLENAGNMIDWITASWTRLLGGKESERMRTDMGAPVDAHEAPHWLREFTRKWTRRSRGTYEFRRR